MRRFHSCRGSPTVKKSDNSAKHVLAFPTLRRYGFRQKIRQVTLVAVGKANTMATNPMDTTETEEIPDIAADLLSALGEVRCVSPADLEAERSADGTLEMDSPEAVAVIAKLEAKYGRQLARVEDLESEQLTTVEELTSLIRDRWASHPVGGRGSRRHA
jgi:acyl carrier protein